MIVLRNAKMVSQENFLGLSLRSDSFDDTVTDIISRSKMPNYSADVHLVNAYNIALSQRDKSYCRCLTAASILLADGRPISVVSRFWGGRIKQVRGPSLFEEVINRGRAFGVRHYLLGSTEHTLAALIAAVEHKYPGACIVGSYSPPFRSMSSTELTEQDGRIVEARPDIVWVGLGTPKQDYEAQRLAASLGVLAVAVGAAFDFTAGTKPVCPKFLRRCGLEWMYRLASEPRRLWKRYLLGNTVFVALVLAESVARVFKLKTSEPDQNFMAY